MRMRKSESSKKRTILRTRTPGEGTIAPMVGNKKSGKALSDEQNARLRDACLRLRDEVFGTGSDLAKALKIDQGQLSRILANKGGGSVATVQAVEKLAKLPPGSILYGDAPSDGDQFAARAIASRAARMIGAPDEAIRAVRNAPYSGAPRATAIDWMEQIIAHAKRLGVNEPEPESADHVVGAPKPKAKATR